MKNNSDCLAQRPKVRQDGNGTTENFKQFPFSLFSRVELVLPDGMTNSNYETQIAEEPMTGQKR
jgi:hypothetical protein